MLTTSSRFSRRIPIRAAPSSSQAVTKRIYSAQNSQLPKSNPAEIAAHSSGTNTHVKPLRQRGDYGYDTLLTELLRDSTNLCSKQTPPTEEEILQVLGECLHLAKMLPRDTQAPPVESQHGAAASALLTLDGAVEKQATQKKRSQAIERIAGEISKVAHNIIKHPSIFISLGILGRYTAIQACLSKPGTLAEAFGLFGSKPVPEQGSSPIKYIKSNPNKLSNAIPPELAGHALEVAIDAKDMLAAIDIIEASYVTTAYKRAKLLRQAMLPAACVGLTPLVAWTIAEKLALLQTNWEQGTATRLAFVGLLAYIGFTGTLGVVALTTANDQMERVTWAAGVPLRERWLREEERAAFDKVAQAWGFRETWRRGEEEGEEWDALREWINNKGMILDKVELMEGME